MNVWLVIFQELWKIIGQHLFKYCFCPYSSFSHPLGLQFHTHGTFLCRLHGSHGSVLLRSPFKQGLALLLKWVHWLAAARAVPLGPTSTCPPLEVSCWWPAISTSGRIPNAPALTWCSLLGSPKPCQVLGPPSLAALVGPLMPVHRFYSCL